MPLAPVQLSELLLRGGGGHPGSVGVSVELWDRNMLQSLELFGPSGGSRWMFREESEAADLALATGIYRVWRSPYVSDCVRRRGLYVSDNGLRLTAYAECFRVGPRSRCFCGHPLSAHSEAQRQQTRQQLLRELLPATSAAAKTSGPAVQTSDVLLKARGRFTSSRRQSLRAGVAAESCSECCCSAFTYIPTCASCILAPGFAAAAIAAQATPTPLGSIGCHHERALMLRNGLRGASADTRTWSTKQQALSGASTVAAGVLPLHGSVSFAIVSCCRPFASGLPSLPSCCAGALVAGGLLGQEDSVYVLEVEGLGDRQRR
ncbi:hypothetical protein Esti_001849 [Eimeria stiedai]